MNLAELVDAVAADTGLPKGQAAKAIAATLEVIQASLSKGEEVRLVGFGSFAVAQRAAREGRNPRTGQTIKVAASKAPVFRAGKGLKDAVNA
jgi:DNA-binding protein HU-beta